MGLRSLSWAALAALAACSNAGTQVPGAPLNVTAKAGNSEATVTWTAPVQLEAPPVTGYQVITSPGGATLSSKTTSATILNLTNGTAYTFAVVALNSAGPGSLSVPSNPVIPSALPGAPENVIAVATNGEATVTWSAPRSDGGSPITRYTVTASPGGATASTQDAMTVVITGLTNGTSYTFTVHATNLDGDGPESDSSAAVTPVTVPGAPLAVSAAALDGAVVASWSPPTDTGGSPILSYTVTASPGGFFIVTDGTALNAVVSGLSDGTPYTVTVHATNVAGNGPESTVSAPVTPAALPGVPTAVVATAGNGQASVTWLPPANTGGAALTGFTVTATPGGLTSAVAAAALTAVVPNLTNGTSYTFTVHATTSLGNGPESLPSSAVTPATVPQAPTGVSAIVTDGQAVVAWTPPADDGGSPILSYTVSVTPGATTITVLGSPALVTGLMDGTNYSFQVTASNAVGSGAPSLPSSSMTASGPPGSPTSVSAVAADGQVTVSWMAPANDGGSLILGYEVVASPPDAPLLMVPASPTTATVTGLNDGTPYVFTVFATTMAGSGPASQPSNAVTPAGLPGAPLTVSAVAANAQATVSWAAPATDGGAPVSSYVVITSPGNATTPASGTSAVITGLTNGTVYEFSVAAINVAGQGASSAPSNLVTPATVSDPPTMVSGVAGNAQATVSWTPPVNQGGSPVTGYVVTELPDNTATSATGTTAVVVGLTNGSPYTFTVAALNGVGVGAASAASAGVTPATVPQAPTIAKVTAGNTQATITWVAPASNGGSAITGYAVVSTPATTTTLAAATATSAIVTGLKNGTSYTFTVTASNSVGAGPASAASIAATPATVPGAPLGVTAVATDSQATVTWSAPASNGGSAVISYAVTTVPGNAVTTTLGTSALVTGLVDGTSYTFTVTASNAVGHGAASAASSAVTPIGLPGAPTALTATAGNAQATVGWTAPVSSGGGTISLYTVTMSPGSTTMTATTNTATFTGLTNGSPYTFTVFATNQAGNGPASLPSSPVTPATTPSAPQTVAAVAGNTQATVTWAAPASNGGLPVTGYTVTATPFGATVSTTGDTTATFTQLTNGTSYTFTVVATNALGPGASSTPTAAVVPVDPPSASASSFTASPAALFTNDVAALEIVVKDSGGTGLPNQPVSISASGGKLTQASGTSDTNGLFMSFLTSTTAQTVSLTATIGTGTRVAFATFTAAPACSATGKVVGLPGVPLGTATGPAAEISLDLNADGHPDLVVANETTGTLSVFLGTGNGTFATPTSVTTGAGPAAVTSADFNGDGIPDLAVANSTAGTVSIFFGTGLGTFTAGPTPTVGTTPSGIVVADFNDDGAPDLAVANKGSNNVTILLNVSAATSFTASNPTFTGSSPVALATADFNDDGKPDLAVVNNGNNTVTPLLNTGAGTFSVATAVTVQLAPVAIAIGDFNRDGKPDFVVANSGIGSFSLVLGSGAGAFGTATPVATQTTPDAIAVGDWNDDGKLDVAVANAGSNTISVVLGTGTGNFGPLTNFVVGNSPSALAVADYNEDGHLDLAAANGTVADVSLLLGNGDGTFISDTTTATGSTPNAVALADFNGDGKLDIATGNASGNNLSILLGNGNGTFLAAIEVTGSSSATTSVVSADFNKDGKPDLATVSGNNAYIMIGNGDGTFISGVPYAVGTAPKSLVAGDFNKDGNIDLATANNTTANVSILLGNGDGTFKTSVAYATATAGKPLWITTADFNADTNLDLAVANNGTNNVSLLLGNGDGTFKAATNFTVDTAPVVILTADFNADGHPDLATLNATNGDVSILLASATTLGTFATAVNDPAAAGATVATLGDYNGDGITDIAVGSTTNSVVAVLLGKKGGTFNTASDYVGVATPLAISSGDFNDDGTTDLAITRASTATVLLNKCL